MEKNQVHKKQKGYSIWKGKLLKFLKKRNFTLSDIATKIGISERELMRHEGVKLEDIQKWLGHSQISTTEKIYAHFSNDQHKNSAMLISNCLG